MLAATGGVNTHRGAIFSLGLALNAAGKLSARRMEGADNERFMKGCLVGFSQSICRMSLNESELHSTAPSHGAKAVKEYGVKGARELACEGYKPLFEDWLPFYRACHFERSREICTLLRIMATLDDTCVIHRVGYDRAIGVKDESKALLKEIPGRAGNDGSNQAGNDGNWIGHLEEMCERYASDGISPGGAADMLALTIFIESILN